MLRIGFPVIGVTDVPRAVAFWTGALDLVATQEWRSDTWRTLNHRDSGVRALGLLRSESPPQGHPRIHLDLFTDTQEEQQAEVQRLIGLGAQAVDWDSYPPDPDFVVLADPDGNIFCVVDLSHAPSGSTSPRL
ncbi:Glyoxalase-like domain protein [Streptomyces sp. YIM 130001]|uniref:VOC family protein n=1 Tax=Streptomyces sp. YIM 130001 TaxID=2259644 RepID=UPI000E64D9C5|nr:VOC family protein [Streptomyces sp. YIM 130001]RII09257.1 Glyoxalase-like domain protein [Streptomyces sp. YIM 130001]